MVRFLADASLHHAIVTGCLRREPGVDFLSAHVAKLHGIGDHDVLEIAAEQGRILVTHDFRTMPKHFAEFVSAGRSRPRCVPRPAAHASCADHRRSRADLDGVNTRGLGKSDCAGSASMIEPTRLRIQERG
jgi:hypothetical protein